MHVIFFNFISLAQPCAILPMSFNLAARIAAFIGSLLPVIQQMKRISAKMTKRNHRTKQVDKLLSQKINYNSVHPHTHTHACSFVSIWRVVIVLFISLLCECVKIHVNVWTKTKMLLLSVPLLQHSNLHLNERSNRLFLDLQALTSTQAHTDTHSKTERQVAVQPLRMIVNNINNVIYFKSTHPTFTSLWMSSKTSNEPVPRSTIFSFLFVFIIHYHVFKWESKHQRVWQLTLS